MSIEKVLLKRHLMAGEKQFPVGIYPNPVVNFIPDEILGELHRGDVVEILEESQPSPSPETKGKKSVWENTKPSDSSVDKPAGRRARKVKNGPK